MTDSRHGSGGQVPNVRPTARPAARRAEREVTARRDGSSGNGDSLRVPVERPIRRGRSIERLRRELSDRDLAVLRDLARLRLMRTGQVERMHFHQGSTGTRPRRCRAVLQRLHAHRLIERLDRRIGGLRAGSTGFIYRLSPKGRRLLGLVDGDARRSRLPEPRTVFQDHVLAVTELVVGLHEAERANRLELVRFEAEPACWRHFTGVGGETITLKPDAFVVMAIGEFEHLSFIEVDLGTESLATIRRKAESYRRYAASGQEQARLGVFPRVVFLTSTARRLRSLVATLHATADGAALFGIGLLDAAVELLAGGAP